MERYGRKVDALPILNVDDDLLAWGARIGETFRNMALAQRSSGIRTGVRKSSVYGNYQYNYDQNGYGSARTFDLRNGKPFLSYDYYLSIDRPVDEAAADLEELMQLNPARPYFLLMHVRESNTIEKVATIIGQLTEPVEVVPLDTFLALAAGAKTYRAHFKQPTDPVNLNP